MEQEGCKVIKPAQFAWPAVRETSMKVQIQCLPGYDSLLNVDLEHHYSEIMIRREVRAMILRNNLDVSVEWVLTHLANAVKDAIGVSKAKSCRI